MDELDFWTIAAAVFVFHHIPLSGRYRPMPMQNRSFVSVLKSVVIHWLPIKRNVTLCIQQTEPIQQKNAIIKKQRDLGSTRLLLRTYMGVCLCDDSNNRGTGNGRNDNNDNAANKNKSVVYHYPQQQ